MSESIDGNAITEQDLLSAPDDVLVQSETAALIPEEGNLLSQANELLVTTQDPEQNKTMDPVGEVSTLHSISEDGTLDPVGEVKTLDPIGGGGTSDLVGDVRTMDHVGEMNASDPVGELETSASVGEILNSEVTHADPGNEYQMHGAEYPNEAEPVPEPVSMYGGLPAELMEGDSFADVPLPPSEFNTGNLITEQVYQEPKSVAEYSEVTGTSGESRDEVEGAEFGQEVEPMDTEAGICPVTDDDVVSQQEQLVTDVIRDLNQLNEMSAVISPAVVQSPEPMESESVEQAFSTSPSLPSAVALTEQAFGAPISLPSEMVSADTGIVQGSETGIDEVDHVDAGTNELAQVDQTWSITESTVEEPEPSPEITPSSVDDGQAEIVQTSQPSEPPEVAISADQTEVMQPSPEELLSVETAQQLNVEAEHLEHIDNTSVSMESRATSEEPAETTASGSAPEVATTAPLDEVQDTAPLDEVQNTAPLDEVQNTTPLDEVQSTAPLDEVQNTAPLDEVQNTSPLDETQNTEPLDEAQNTAPSEVQVQNTVELEDGSRQTSPAEEQKADRLPESMDAQSQGTDSTGDQTSGEQLCVISGVQGTPQADGEKHIGKEETSNEARTVSDRSSNDPGAQGTKLLAKMQDAIETMSVKSNTSVSSQGSAKSKGDKGQSKQKKEPKKEVVQIADDDDDDVKVVKTEQKPQKSAKQAKESTKGNEAKSDKSPAKQPQKCIVCQKVKKSCKCEKLPTPKTTTKKKSNVQVPDINSNTGDSNISKTPKASGRKSANTTPKSASNKFLKVKISKGEKATPTKGPSDVQHPTSNKVIVIEKAVVSSVTKGETSKTPGSKKGKVAGKQTPSAKTKQSTPKDAVKSQGVKSLTNPPKKDTKILQANNDQTPKVSRGRGRPPKLPLVNGDTPKVKGPNKRPLESPSQGQEERKPAKRGRPSLASKAHQLYTSLKHQEDAMHVKSPHTPELRRTSRGHVASPQTAAEAYMSPQDENAEPRRSGRDRKLTARAAEWVAAKANADSVNSDGVPVISDVVSLAQAVGPSPISVAPQAKANKTNQQTSVGVGPTGSSSTITQHIIIEPPKPKQVRNKSLLCKPYCQTKATSCRPHTQNKETQTDGEPEKKPVIVPVPVPIYIPTPMAMYSFPQPYPVPVPVPIPVPCFIPTTKKSAESILRHIKEIQERIPADPFEAELLMLAEAVATADKSGSESSSSEDEEPELPPAPVAKPEPIAYPTTVVDPPTELGEDMLQMALRMASEISEEPVLDLEDNLHPNPVQPMDSQFSTIDESSDILSTSPRSSPRSRRGRRSRGRGRPKKARYDEDPTYEPSVPVPDAQPTETKPVLADENMVLKYSYGVNAWKHWVVQKNSQLEKAATGSRRKLKLFKTDLLACTADELNYSLCLFVKEVRKPNGEAYACDSIYYLCLGIQQYLYENGRIDNIFTDFYYERFTECLNEVLLGYEVRLNAQGLIVCRIEEEHLWECKQLGAHSPYILLNTLIYFNTKYFHLKTPDDHVRLSFSHIMKHWKRANGQPITTKSPAAVQGAKSVYLRYYAPPPNSGPEAGQKRKREEAPIYEQGENTDNPLRCPVKLYEFYLSKCPESIKNRNDVFYLVPERSCVPDSPVWYSTGALGADTMMKMLNRLRVVREIQECYLQNHPMFV